MDGADYYELLCFLSMFKKGIPVRDFGDASKVFNQEHSWLEVLYIFVKVTDRLDFVKNEYTYLRQIDEILDKKPRVSEEEDELEFELQVCLDLEKESGPHKSRYYILNVAPEDLFRNENLIISANPALRQIISLSEDDHEHASFMCLRLVVNYYSEFAASVMKYCVGISGNDEPQHVFPDLVHGLFWVENEVKTYKWNSCLRQSNFRVDKIEQFLHFHEDNISFIFTNPEFSLSSGMIYVSKKEKYRQQFLQSVEEFITNLLAMFRTFGSEEASAELMMNSRQLLKHLRDLGLCSRRLEVRVELLCLGIYCNEVYKKQQFTTKTKRAIKEKLLEGFGEAQVLIDNYDGEDK